MSGGSRHAGAPRTLDVQKFANARGVEVQALHAALKDRKGKDGSDAGIAIPRCLRRRTTSHNRRKSFFWQRKATKRKPESATNADSGAPTPGSDEVAVPAKRPCRRVRRKIEFRGDENGGGGCSRDGTQRLVTHVWHAKRFTMTKLWGHCLAEGLPGRGRGSRAVIGWKDKAALLHDASFYSAIELEGSEESIMEALQLVLEPAPPRCFELMSTKDHSVHRGAEYGKAMLHHLGRSPRGAISPVTYIWRRQANVGEERRIWLWVHAAAFEEALACLQILCQSQGIDGKNRLQCWSRKGRFGRLDLFGSRAMSVLKKVLHPVARSTSQEGDMDSLFHSHSDGAVIEMEVWDPRYAPDSDTKFEPSFLSDAGFDENGADDMDIVGKKSEHSPTLNQLDVESTDIWGRSGPTGQESVVMPLSEKDISSRRHKKRLSYIHLNEVTEDTQGEQPATDGYSKCSVVVLQHDYSRFSLILPIGWVRAFWVPLVFAGGHVIGLRERHWLQTDAKLASFPHDYPDCYSYDQHMAEKSAEYQETYNRRPPSKRGLWKNELLGWEFAHQAALLDSGNCMKTPEVSRADFGAEVPCGTVAADSSKTANSGLATISSAGSEGPSAQLNFCSSTEEVPRDDRGPNDDSGISKSVNETSSTVVSKPSSDSLVSSPARDLPAQAIASDGGADCSIVSVGVLQEGQRDDTSVELHGESAPQPDPASSSQPMAIADVKQERTSAGSAADLEELLATKDRGESKSIDTGESSMFVARTSEALQQFLKDDGLHHLPFFAKAEEKLLSNGHPGSQPADDGSAEVQKRGCLVRVLIHAPRKGVFDEGATIYLPLACDVDSYFQSSPRWQGFEDPRFKQVEQSHNPSRQTSVPEPRSERCSLRVPMGIVTSASVRGSSSSASIGICEVAGLGVLRARQMADERWDSTSEIFLLVRNKCSSMYRPALASIVAETGDDLE